MNHLDDRSRELRRLVARGLAGGQRGHIESSLSLIEILRVLFDHHLQYRPQEPNWKDRDRFLLSKGHGLPGFVRATRGQRIYTVGGIGSVL